MASSRQVVPGCVRISNLIQTCSACPSQWEAVSELGQEVYIRYRWGTLRVDLDGEPFFETDLDDALDGFLDTDAMLRATGLELEPEISNKPGWPSPGSGLQSS
jgi:hypothetical protein